MGGDGGRRAGGGADDSLQARSWVGAGGRSICSVADALWSGAHRSAAARGGPPPQLQIANMQYKTQVEL